MTRRKEFTPKTKRQALERSGGQCEAVGQMYGLKSQQRCETDITSGAEYDHYIAATFDGDNSLANCRAVCIPCHRYRTKQEAPVIAKSNRVRSKHQGIKRPKGKIQSRGFNPQPIQQSPGTNWDSIRGAVTARRV